MTSNWVERDLSFERNLAGVTMMVLGAVTAVIGIGTIAAVAWGVYDVTTLVGAILLCEGLF